MRGDISDKAKTCPHCGYSPIIKSYKDEEKDKDERPFRNGRLIAGALLITISGILFLQGLLIYMTEISKLGYTWVTNFEFVMASIFIAAGGIIGIISSKLKEPSLPIVTFLFEIGAGAIIFISFKVYRDLFIWGIISVYIGTFFLATVATKNKRTPLWFKIFTGLYLCAILSGVVLFIPALFS